MVTNHWSGVLSCCFEPLHCFAVFTELMFLIQIFRLLSFILFLFFLFTISMASPPKITRAQVDEHLRKTNGCVTETARFIIRSCRNESEDEAEVER